MGRYGMIGWCRPVSRAHREAARACLDRVGMADFADRQIGQLSGGQQQRVFLARALAQEARIYFMDEPFAGVDAATERAVIQVLRDLDTAGRTVICVHHDLQTVADYFDHVLLLNTPRRRGGACRHDAERRELCTGPMAGGWVTPTCRARAKRVAEAGLA